MNPERQAAARPARDRQRWWRARPVLLVAFAASVVLHLALTLVPDDLGDEPDGIPLAATIRELPPPPTASSAPAPPKPATKRPTTPRPAPAAAPEAVAEAPAPAIETPAGTPPAAEAAPATTEAQAAAPLAEDVVSEEPAVATKPLPPRVDLAYKVFYGTQGFWIGSATYRFEHADNRYRIATVGEARGLAALLFRGRGRMESRGVITGNGLQPHEFVVDKFNQRGAERAEFDWEAGLATLHGDSVAPLELPTYDILALMWQFYFQPPEDGRQTFALATTRRIMRATVARERAETISWSHGQIDTEVWRRTSEDGKTDAYVWLAPSLRWLPVKMRVINTTRGTVEALLDQIRVDDSQAGEAAAAAATRSDAGFEPPPLPADPSPPVPAQPSPLEYDNKP